MIRARTIALYLPQFHPIPENDAWWGSGFTEWTNTAKARPLFRGHHQPHIPADLGFYDLRTPETREAQAALARCYGVEAFCYYHYWFAGKRILERPFNEVLTSGKPDFPFCLAWANETWTGVWHGAPNRILIEQTYPGPTDHEKHFQTLLPAFRDPRYVCVEGKPLFLIYRPEQLPNAMITLASWREFARSAGLPGLFIGGMSAHADWDPRTFGFDAKVTTPLINNRDWPSAYKRPVAWARAKYDVWRCRPKIIPYENFVEQELRRDSTGYETFPCLIHAWDNTPRSGHAGVVLQGSKPELFRKLLEHAFRTLSYKPPARRLLFLKSWNEWAEGNHLEPDLEHGHAWLREIRAALSAENNCANNFVGSGTSDS